MGIEDLFKGIEVLSKAQYAAKKKNGTLDKHTIYATDEDSIYGETEGTAYEGHKGKQNSENIRILAAALEEAYTEQAAALSSHNVDESAHSDMRLLIGELTKRLNALANSEDIDLDQMSELVAYIKANRSDIAELTTDKVKYADIIDDLVTNVNNKPLSAAQGVVLNGMIASINEALKTKIDKVTAVGGVKVYAVNVDGTQYMLPVGITAAGSYVDRLPVYFSVTNAQGDKQVLGALLCATPEKPYQTANKEYVDNAIATAINGALEDSY